MNVLAHTLRTAAILAMTGIALAWPAVSTAADPPANDAFATPTALFRSTGEVRVSNLGATKEAGEPNHGENPGGKSVWFVWTAPVDGQFAFDTLATYGDTLLAVYTGSAVENLTLVAENDDADPTIERSLVSFRATAGTEYHIAVDGFGGKRILAKMSWHPAPLNDNIADAFPLTGRSGDIEATTVGATWEWGEPYYTDVSVWYRWTAPETGSFSFTTHDTDVDTILLAFIGDNAASLQFVADNDDDDLFGCCLSRLVLNAIQGQTYAIAAGGYAGSTGVFGLAWRPIIWGTSGADVITGSADSEEIRAGGGNDTVHSGGGNDEIFGGTGADRLFGDDGTDFVYDRTGRDLLRGGLGDDLLLARDGNGGDALGGGQGIDRCRGDRADRRTGCP